MHRPLRLMVCAAFAVSAAAFPVLARPTKVALTQIDGDTTGLWMAMEDALDDTSLEIVPTRRVTRMIEKLGLDEDLPDRDIKKLAAKLDVDVIVQGLFEARARKLRFTIFANGKMGKPFNIQAGDAGSDKFRKRVHTTMMAKLAAAMQADDAAVNAGGTASDEAKSKQPKAAGNQATPKETGELVAGVSDSAKQAKTTKQAKAADDAVEIANADDNPKQPNKAKKQKGGGKAVEIADANAGPKQAKQAKQGKEVDDFVEISDDEADPKPTKKTTKQKGTEPVAATEDDSAKKAKSKGNNAKVTDEPVADAGDSAKQPKKAKQQKGTGEAVAADDSPAPAKQTKKAKGADDAGQVAGDSTQQARELLDPTTAAAEAKPGEPSASPEADAPPAAAKQVAARDDDEITPRAQARFDPSTRVPHSTNRVAVRVDLGMSMSTRDLRFKTTTLDNAPRPYKNAPAPGARAEAELYPFALRAQDSWLAGIGVAGDFDQTVALTLRASAEMTAPLKITERHYSFGLRYRLALGHAPTSPTLTIGGGYGARTFAVNRGGLPTGTSLDLPDVNYKLFDPGLAFRLPIGNMVAVTLGGRALLVTAAGQIQRADQYGQAKLAGGAASAGIEVTIRNGIGFRIAAEATQFSYKFAGTGALATSRDGDLSTLDVSRATDRYLGGAATLAVNY